MRSVILLLLAAGCSTANRSGSDGDGAQGGEGGPIARPDGAVKSDTSGEGADAKVAKAAKHARAVELARHKLAQARLEQRVAEKKHQATVDQAARELSLADQELRQFAQFDVPLRTQKAELELKEREDGLAETLEEFEQLKLMYAEQDLADKTRELVLHRTERRIEQSKKELELARAQVEQLKTAELAQQRAKLEAEVSEKQNAIAAAQLDSDVSAHEKAVSVLEAEHGLADAEADVKEDGGKDGKDAEVKSDDDKSAAEKSAVEKGDGDAAGEGGEGEEGDDE